MTVISVDRAPAVKKHFIDGYIPVDFMGIHFHRWPNNAGGPPSSNPTIEYSMVRTLDGNNLKWSDINTSSGVYNWTTMDQVYSRHVTDGKGIVYTVVCTPTWASARPAENRSPWGVLGGSAEPSNMADLVTFVQTLVNRYPLLNYLEVWNEPAFPVPGSGLTFYSGSPQKLAEMVRVVSQAAKAIRPGIKILSPPVSNIPNNMHAAWGSTNPTDSLTQIYTSSAQGYDLGFGDGGGTTCRNFIDIVAFHTYQGGFQFGHKLFHQINGFSEYLTTLGINHLPKWATEVGHIYESFSTEEDQARKIARLLICSAAAGCEKVFYYSWDHDTDGSGNQAPTDCTGVSTRPIAAYKINNYINEVMGRLIDNIAVLESKQIFINFSDGDSITI